MSQSEIDLGLLRDESSTYCIKYLVDNFVPSNIQTQQILQGLSGLVAGYSTNKTLFFLSN